MTLSTHILLYISHTQRLCRAYPDDRGLALYASQSKQVRQNPR